MVVTVEDGTGLAAADVYVTIVTAELYLNSIAGTGNAFTSLASDALKEQALRGGTIYLDETYEAEWKGVRINSTMALDHPRTGVTDEDGYVVLSTAVPVPVERACAEMAQRIAADTTGHETSKLTPDQDTPGTIKRERVEADVVSDITYTGANQQKRYSRIDNMLSGLLEPVGRVALA